MSRQKVLFFAEGATLAHVARPIVLASTLDPDEFDICLYRPVAYAQYTGQLPFKVCDLECQSSAEFIRRLENGSPLYDLQTLQRYVDDELRIIDEERPDLIVGDFRISLAVSARLKSIRYISICDAYWSHETPLVPPLPVFKFTRYLPLRPSGFIFSLIIPTAFRLHAIPMERLRQKYGLPGLGHDLRRVYTDADVRLFANFRQLYPATPEHEGACFIGPVSWSPAVESRFEFGDEESPLVYVTMGSSGDPRILDEVIPELEDFQFRIVVATAGKPVGVQPRLPTTKIIDFVSGSEVCRQASLVICNGGSPTTNQALSSGVPVLGIARNMDQFLNMNAIVKFGAGILLRSDRASRQSIGVAARTILEDQAYSTQAKKLARESQEVDYLARFTQALRIPVS